MTVPGSPLKDLRIFLEGAFRTSQRERFLVGNEQRDVANAADKSAGATDYCFDLVEELKRRDILSAAFFDRLAHERAGHGDRVRALERAVLERPDPDAGPRLLSQTRVEELLDTAARAGLDDYDRRMDLLDRTAPNLPAAVGRPKWLSELLRRTLNPDQVETRSFSSNSGSSSNLGHNRAIRAMGSRLIRSMNARQASNSWATPPWQTPRVTSSRIQSHSRSIGLRSGL